MRNDDDTDQEPSPSRPRTAKPRPPASDPRTAVPRALREDTRSRRQSGEQAPTVARMLVWVALFMAIVFVGMRFESLLGKATSAIQEASLAAMCCTVFIGLYILARCVDQFLAGFQQLQSK